MDWPNEKGFSDQGAESIGFSAFCGYTEVMRKFRERVYLCEVELSSIEA